MGYLVFIQIGLLSISVHYLLTEKLKISLKIHIIKKVCIATGRWTYIADFFPLELFPCLFFFQIFLVDVLQICVVRKSYWRVLAVRFAPPHLVQSLCLLSFHRSKLPT